MSITVLPLPTAPPPIQSIKLDCAYVHGDALTITRLPTGRIEFTAASRHNDNSGVTVIVPPAEFDELVDLLVELRKQLSTPF